jgi:hypothetical protein
MSDHAARRKCWADCREGRRPEQQGQDSYTRCCDPRVCHGWSEYVEPKAVTQKLLVIGYGRHGKDTVCEILRDQHGYSFISSSRFVFEECIWKSLWCARYPDKETCYEDRGNHRNKWFNMIAEYNTPDKSRTVTGMFAQGYSIYCGLRSREEFEATRHLFDKILWVDRHMFQAPEPSSSMELTTSWITTARCRTWSASLQTLWPWAQK